MSDTPDSAVFLGRQPILDREQQLLAYELLFRGGAIATANRADILDGAQATATVIANTFAEFSTNNALGPYRGFINVDTTLLFSELIEVLPPKLIALEILESVLPSPEVVARCASLKASGFTLVMDDVIELGDEYRPLFAHIDIIKVDIAQLTPDALRSLIAKLKPLGKKLLAEKVETTEDLALCRELGFDLFQGYFFAKPTVLVGKKLTPSQVALLRLLALIMGDADTPEIEKAFKLEPGLTVNLLRLTNSVSSGLSTRITSLRHAITLLGRRQLMRWLQLLIYTNPGSTKTSPLLSLAATRGRLMELFAEKIQRGDREISEQAFMVGIMSLIPALLGMSMTSILEQLPVTQRVRDALIDGQGTLGQLLVLAQATEEQTETPETEAVTAARRAFPDLNERVISRCLADAMSWANNLEREND